MHLKSQELREKLAATFVKFLTAPPRQCSAILLVKDAFEAHMLDSWGDQAKEIAKRKSLVLNPMCNGRVEFVTIILPLVETIGVLRRLIEVHSPPDSTFIFIRSSEEDTSVKQRFALRSQGYHVIPLAAMPPDGDLAPAIRAHLELVANSAAAALWTRLVRALGK
ncbi:hypothetical protein FOL47_005375 [Perkinsus chesapeaki]|uniref:Uncharacterized protein n=1 Tax=Perkinsus chesapeaki TaxID=330153 RepID=A0A7J6N2X7_PERCH|nr:hypothetical protein FOL47_005375 [Perkinsus chesapeaki]